MINKRLTEIVLVSALVFGNGGCENNSNPEYHFKGDIEGEQVYFYEQNLGSINILEVTKKDGTKVRYEDRKGNDFKLESVTFTIGDNTTSYRSISKNGDVVEIVQKAQIDFDSYLKKIIENQTVSLNKY